MSLKEFFVFEKTMSKIFDIFPNVLEYAKTLDSYSTSTFNHSVNVALHFHNIIVKDSSLSEREILEWTAAAFVHDAGKLTTPLDILHSKINYKNESISQEDRFVARTKMMRHSIDGLEVAEAYNFNKKMLFAVIGHHIDAKAIDNGPEENFFGATFSRDTWEKSFGKDYVEKMLQENCKWVTKKDRQMLKTLSIIDTVEAMRSFERMYNNKEPKKWEMILRFNKEDAANGKLDPSLVESITKSHLFQKSFDELQSYNSPQRIRHLVFEKGKDIPYVLSADKINEIMENPSCGEPFFKFEKEKAIFVIDVGDGRMLSLPLQKEVPNFMSKISVSEAYTTVNESVEEMEDR